jgi:hypothetical protein
MSILIFRSTADTGAKKKALAEVATLIVQVSADVLIH